MFMQIIIGFWNLIAKVMHLMSNLYAGLYHYRIH